MELAKLFNRPVHLYDQDRGGWFDWEGSKWTSGVPQIEKNPFAGSGTRYLTDDGK